MRRASMIGLAAMGGGLVLWGAWPREPSAECLEGGAGAAASAGS